MPKTILHLTSIESGGAAMFSSDINDFLNSHGYSSYFLVRGKSIIYPDGNRYDIFLRNKNFYQKMLRFLSRKIFEYVKIDNKYLCLNLYERFTCYSAKDILDAMPVKPDVIYVHWASDFVNAKIIYDLFWLTQAKINIIMIDNAPLTGGCHYPWNCNGYKTDCSNCPAIKNKILKNWNKYNLSFKKKFFENCQFELITASPMDYQRALTSTLYKNKIVKHIYFPVDEEKYKPLEDKGTIMDEFSIVTDKKIIFLGSSFLDEERKGMNILTEAIKRVKNKNLFFLIAGNGHIDVSPYEYKILGRLDEPDLIKAYQVSDVYVCPSVEDSGPMMVLQSLMCGTPVVAFNQGYAMEVVETGITGFKSVLGDPDSLAEGIDYLTSLDNTVLIKMKNTCRTLSLNLFSKLSLLNRLSEIQ